jgi:hypothetical protein
MTRRNGTVSNTACKLACNDGEKAKRFGDQPKLTKGREATLSEFLRDVIIGQFF